MIEEIKRLANLYFDEAKFIRRHLHMNPELSYHETNTCRYIAQKLTDWGIANKTIANTGVLATINGSGSTEKVIALRSDHDALPIDEENDVSYKSLTNNIAHMCGHDAHTACNLISARILNQIRENLNGTVRLLFQPGEEIIHPNGISGAEQMMNDGGLSDPIPFSIIAQHVNPRIPVGKVGISMNDAMASVDTIKIRIQGKGGHAAMPENCTDPILISSHIILALQNIRSRLISPKHPVVLSICKISGGELYNIIPDEVNLLGTLRTYHEDTRAEIHNLIRQISSSVSNAFGGSAHAEVIPGPPSLKNNFSIAENVKQSAIEFLGKDNVIETEPYMTGEDFAFYTKKIPACFYWLGVRNEEAGIINDLHSAKMDIDENALKIGSGLFAYIAYSNLK